MKVHFAKNQKEFQEHYMFSSLPSMRFGLGFTILMFFGFMIFNFIAFPGSPELLFFRRFGFMVPALTLAIIMTYIPRLYKWLHLMYIILNLMICLGIFYVGYSSGIAQKGYEYYFAWVMLMVIGLFVFFRMQFRMLVITGVLQVAAFCLASYLNGSYAADHFVVLNHLFFILAMFITGLLMAYMFRNLYMRNFIHQKALAENNLQLIEEVRERKTAVEALQQSEIQYHNTLDSIPDWIFVVDRHFRIVMINSALKEGNRMACLPMDVVGKKLLDVYPFMTTATIDELQRVFDSGEITITDQPMSYGTGRTFYMENRKVPVYRNNEVYQVMTILRDRSKEKEVEELKQRNAEQKEIMLREIHHRVKNNLAIVISLLNLQLRNNTYPGLKRIISDIEMRIRSMALIHEHLYRSENLEMIPLASYVHSLATIISSTFSGHRVTLDLSLEPVEVSIETALPIGLITNELITNAFKYAFPDHGSGIIQIRLKKGEDSAHTLMIRDDGIGLPDTFSLDSENSLGMFIVRLLVEQLDGKLVIEKDHGTIFTIHFRNLTVKPR